MDNIAYVEGSISEDLEEIRRLTDAAGEQGYLLVCELCYDLLEPIVAIITIPSEDAVFGVCGVCYRDLAKQLLGPVM